MSTTQTDEDTIVKALDKLNVEYNESLGVYTDAETASKETDLALIMLSINDFSKTTNLTATAEELAAINETRKSLYLSFIKNKTELLQKQTKSFILLQKLYASHIPYLMGAIRALQAKLVEVNKSASQASESAQAESVAEAASVKPVPATSSRLASTGKLPA